jgi:hypothetical protein
VVYSEALSKGDDFGEPSVAATKIPDNPRFATSRALAYGSDGFGKIVTGAAPSEKLTSKNVRWP